MMLLLLLSACHTRRPSQAPGCQSAGLWSTGLGLPMTIHAQRGVCVGELLDQRRLDL